MEKKCQQSCATATLKLLDNVSGRGYVTRGGGGLGGVVREACESICAGGRCTEAGATLFITFFFVSWTALALAFYVKTKGGRQYIIGSSSTPIAAILEPPVRERFPSRGIFLEQP